MLTLVILYHYHCQIIDDQNFSDRWLWNVYVMTYGLCEPIMWQYKSDTSTTCLQRNFGNSQKYYHWQWMPGNTEMIRFGIYTLLSRLYVSLFSSFAVSQKFCWYSRWRWSYALHVWWRLIWPIRELVVWPFEEFALYVFWKTGKWMAPTDIKRMDVCSPDGASASQWNVTTMLSSTRITKFCRCQSFITEE